MYRFIVDGGKVALNSILAIRRAGHGEGPTMSAERDQDLPPIVLAFAATDPSGGAGLTADLLALASMGCHPLSVVTALTVQDTLGLESMQPVDAESVAEQARCVLEDMPVDGFKVGALGNVENVAAVAEILSDYPDVPLVLDPVLVSARGDELAGEDMVRAIAELLVPQTTVLVVTGPEARRLADAEDDDESSAAACAGALIERGCEFVLVTGANEPGREVVNTLYGRDGVVRTDAWPRLPGTFHGAGGTLAAALAAMLANGLDMPEAAREAQDYTWHALKKAYRPGMGRYLPDRLFWARDEREAIGEPPEPPRPDARDAH
jgi:hydroxymethylpyrimidine/phosphomethylpyrimidine kinase